ncbi:MAG: tRNA (cytidine(34)-2'-O)-methyltransferase [Deltaproteobacteria bacterium]|nr:tRNA (cytidine(34)-2'-O)-methyltransferase [Deltaproteobacteria bacterium]
MNVVLVEPEIPQNTGSIARLCAGTGTPLHLCGRLGFSLEDRYLKRAGLDYWPSVDLRRHASLDDLCAANPTARFFFLSTRAKQPYTDVHFAPGDFIVFGKETKGLPVALVDRESERVFRIPINDKIRSLNLANAVSIVLFEALRQNAFPGLQSAHPEGECKCHPAKPRRDF